MSPKNKIVPFAELGPSYRTFLQLWFRPALHSVTMFIFRIMFVHIGFITRKCTLDAMFLKQ